MQKLKMILTAMVLTIAVTSCGNSESKTTTTTSDSVGAAPAPPSDATNMSQTSTDSLNNPTTDVKADTPLQTNQPATK